VVEPSPPAGRVPRPTLRRGDVGDLVKLVQRRCKVDADGLFGAKTEAAVRDFQRIAGLLADGIVGPKTWQKFDESG
jgi:peptidoglycan hydrolase-like protein with peptidoglycan-binding domain